MSKKYTHCAECGTELGDVFCMYLDNYLQVKYFDCPDGKDNVFCSENCAGDALMLEEVRNADEKP